MGAGTGGRRRNEMNKDIEIYLGTDERYEYNSVPDDVREKVWELLEPYWKKIIEEESQ